LPKVALQEEEKEKESLIPTSAMETYDSVLVNRLLIAFIGALFLAIRSKKNGSLSNSGAITAFFVGFLTLLAGYRFAVVLLVFFFSSSKLTRFKAERKKFIEDEYKVNGHRNWKQVVSNGGLGTLMCILYLNHYGFEEISLHSSLSSSSSSFDSSSTLTIILVFFGHYTCCNADTWASELGVLNPSQPRLFISPWRTVPAGTNGGISLRGTTAALVGGATIGFSLFIGDSLFATTSLITLQWASKLIFLGALVGLLGSSVSTFLSLHLLSSPFLDFSVVLSLALTPHSSLLTSPTLSTLLPLFFLSLPPTLFVVLSFNFSFRSTPS
jgi:uncharacterized membrane protein